MCSKLGLAAAKKLSLFRTTIDGVADDAASKSRAMGPNDAPSGGWCGDDHAMKLRLGSAWARNDSLKMNPHVTLHNMTMQDIQQIRAKMAKTH